jgi:hypothetical protein
MKLGEKSKMNHYRITKFNPKYRRKDGTFKNSDWTSAYETDNVKKYLNVETSYCRAVLDCINFSGLTKVKAHSQPNKYRVLNLTGKTRTINVAEWTAIDSLVRLALREEVDLKLTGPNSFYAHFGYDFYMYIGGEFQIKTAKLHGLFVELFRSPYLEKRNGKRIKNK